MKKYTWGILGLGKIAQAFAKAVNSTENAELVCASRSEEKARSFAAKYGAKRYYGSYQLLAEDNDVDIVYIATPMSCHYDDVRLCLEHGRNVLCEKSVTVNAAQWSELSSLAREKGLFLMEAMWMKCLPSYRKAKEWIAQGRIGTPTAVKAEFCNYCKYDENDRLFRMSLGGGSLLDLGVYVLTLACDILGYEPDEVYSAMKLGESGADFSDSVLLKYKNNTYAELTSSFEFTSENYAVIIGTAGRITLGPWFHCSRNACLYEYLTDTSEEFDGSFDCNGYEYEIVQAQKCLEASLTESPLVPHGETLAVMRLMDEIRGQNGLVYPQRN